MFIDVCNFNLDLPSFAEGDRLTTSIQLVTGATIVLYFNGDIKDPISVFFQCFIIGWINKTEFSCCRIDLEQTCLSLGCGTVIHNSEAQSILVSCVRIARKQSCDCCGRFRNFVEVLVSRILISGGIQEFRCFVGISDVNRDFLNHADFGLSAINCGYLVRAYVDFVGVIFAIIIGTFEVRFLFEVQDSERLIANLNSV